MRTLLYVEKTFLGFVIKIQRVTKLIILRRYTMYTEAEEDGKSKLSGGSSFVLFTQFARVICV